MERMANLYLNSQAEYASDSSSPEGTLFLRARLDICSPEITSGYSSDDADADAGTSASAAELYGSADPGSLIADVTVADAVAELEEEEGATSGTGTELGIGMGMGMGVGIAGGGGGGGDGGSEKVSATSPLFLSLMMKKMVIPFPVNNQSRRDSKNNPFFPSAVQLIAQPPSNSTNTSRRGSFSSARSSSTKQSVVSFSQPDIPASAVRLLEMEIKRNLRRKSHAKKPAQNSEDRQKFLPNRASGRSYCEIFEISKNDVQLDIDSMYGEKEVSFKRLRTVLSIDDGFHLL